MGHFVHESDEQDSGLRHDAKGKRKEEEERKQSHFKFMFSVIELLQQPVVAETVQDEKELGEDDL